MDPLSITTSALALAEFVKKLAEYTHAVKNAPQEASKLVRELETLHILLGRLATPTKQKDGAKHETALLLSEPGGPLDQMQDIIRSLGTHLDKVKSGQLRHRLIWPFRLSEVKSAIAAVERLKTVFIFALANDSAGITRSIKADAEEIKAYLLDLKEGQESISEDVSILRRQTDELTSQKHAADLHRIASWLCPDEYAATQSARLQEKLKERVEGTTGWVQTRPQYLKWTAAKGSSLLYCSGIPGAGKSVLAATVVQSLQKRHDSSQTCSAFHFCLYSETTQTVESVLGFLVRQILLQQQLIPREILSSFNRHKARETTPSADELIGFFKTLSSMYAESFVVIDALDECIEEQREALIRHLIQPQIHSKVLVTSRPWDDIEKTIGCPELAIEIQASSADIETLIASRLAESSLLKTVVGNDVALVREIQAIIVEKSKSMFLLARLHLDAIAKKPLKSQVRKTLMNLADTIPSTYIQALDRIDEGAQGLVRRILAWVSFARYPLTAEQISYLVAIDESPAEKIDGDDLLDPELVVRLCQGLIAIEPNTSKVHLIHETLQNFLSHQTEKWYPEVLTYLADSCLAFLLSPNVREFSRVQDGGPSWKKYWEGQPPILEYVARHFASHSLESSSQSTQDLLRRLWDDDAMFDRLKRILARARFGRGWASRSNTGLPGVLASYGRLHLAAGLGLVSMLQWRLNRWGDVNQYAHVARIRAGGIEEYLTPLCIAARQGHVEAVKVLLDAGADINAPSRAIPNQVSVPYGQVAKHVTVELYSPLASSARQRKSATMRLLIQRGASIAATGLPTETRMPGNESIQNHSLLYHALLSPPTALAVLLEHGFDTRNVKPPVLHSLTKHDKNDRTSAEWSTRRERNDLSSYSKTEAMLYKMNLVLKNGADINGRDADGRTSVMYAVQGAKVNATRFLIDQGADLTLTDDAGRNPLDWALGVITGSLVDETCADQSASQPLHPVSGEPLEQSKVQHDKRFVGAVPHKINKLRVILAMLQAAMGLEVVDPIWTPGEKADKPESDSFEMVDEGLQMMYGDDDP